MGERGAVLTGIFKDVKGAKLEPTLGDKEGKFIFEGVEGNVIDERDSLPDEEIVEEDKEGDRGGKFIFEGVGKFIF